MQVKISSAIAVDQDPSFRFCMAHPSTTRHVQPNAYGKVSVVEYNAVILSRLTYVGIVISCEVALPVRPSSKITVGRTV